jgi:competence protein ComEC
MPPAAPSHGEAWITTLDVGQGLAVVVRTAHRTLLYDAGPQFGADADSGERIIAPYLRAIGTARLDALVVTHNDADHSGGAASVIANFEVDEFLSSLPVAHPLHAMVPGSRGCARGAQWQWDGVRFEILHPLPEDAAARRANNRSCVLRVSAGPTSMLLTGDIERAAEEALLHRDRAALPAQVLLAPHHGSRTSSSEAFLEAVRPALAVIAAGYRNRFGHPAPEVLGRYAELGTRILRTDLDGAITVRLGPAGPEATGERTLRARYWRSPGG